MLAKTVKLDIRNGDQARSFGRKNTFPIASGAVRSYPERMFHRFCKPLRRPIQALALRILAGTLNDRLSSPLPRTLDGSRLVGPD